MLCLSMTVSMDELCLSMIPDFQRGILFSFEDYLELVDCTGRISQNDKRGAIDEKALPILELLNLDPGQWCERATRFEETYQDYRKSRRRRAA